MPNEREQNGRRIEMDSPGTTSGSNTYPINARCGNCLWTGSVAVPKGVPAPWGKNVGDAVACPDCGCHELIRETRILKETEQTREDLDALARQLAEMGVSPDELERILADADRPTQPVPAADVSAATRAAWNEWNRQQGQVRRTPSPYGGLDDMIRRAQRWQAFGSIPQQAAAEQNNYAWANGPSAAGAQLRREQQLRAMEAAHAEQAALQAALLNRSANEAVMPSLGPARLGQPISREVTERNTAQAMQQLVDLGIVSLGTAAASLGLDLARDTDKPSQE